MTARLREQAACFASAMAHDRVEYPWNCTGEIQDAVGASGAAVALAFKAMARTVMNGWDEAWAEACSMLRNHEVP